MPGHACNICFKIVKPTKDGHQKHIAEMRKAMGSQIYGRRYAPGPCDNSKVIISSTATKLGKYLDNNGHIPHELKVSVARRNKYSYNSNVFWNKTYQDIMDNETLSSETESESDESISEEVIDENPKVQEISTPPSPSKRSISLLIGEGMTNPTVTLKKQKTGTMMTISF